MRRRIAGLLAFMILLSSTFTVHAEEIPTNVDNIVIESTESITENESTEEAIETESKISADDESITEPEQESEVEESTETIESETFSYESTEVIESIESQSDNLQTNLESETEIESETENESDETPWFDDSSYQGPFFDQRIGNYPEVDQLIQIIENEIGNGENADGSTKYGSWYGMPSADWCAMFISWCADQADISTDIIPKFASCSSGIEWFMNNQRWQPQRYGYIPSAGDLIFFRNSIGNPAHVGWVISYENGKVKTVEGNTVNNMVEYCEYDINDPSILGYGVPAYTEVPKEDEISDRPESYTVYQSNNQARAVGQVGKTWAMYRTITQDITIPQFGNVPESMWSHIIQYNGETHTSYCIEYGNAIDPGQTMTWTDLNPNQRRNMGFALYYGWKYNAYDEGVYSDYTNRTEYAMTQATIWACAANIFGTDAGDQAARLVANYTYMPDHAWTYYQNLKNQILTAQSIPSFSKGIVGIQNADPIMLNWNAANSRYEATVTDTNGVLSRFDFSMDGVTFSKNGNNLTISTTNIINTPTVSNAASYDPGGGGEKAVATWDGANGQQDMVTECADRDDPVKAYVKVQTGARPVDVKIQLTVNKADSESKEPLSGAVFDVYEWNGSSYAKVGTMTDNHNGSYTYSVTKSSSEGASLSVNFKVVEVTAPSGYINSGWSYIFKDTQTVSYNSPTISYKTSVENKPVKGKIDLVKIDSQTGGDPQGDASLEGAEYDVFAKEQIKTPDGKTVAYEAYKDGDGRDSRSYVGTMVTDAKGKASLSNLYLGSYYVIERDPSTGYLIDSNHYTANIKYKDQNTATVETLVTSTEVVKKQPIALKKMSSADVTPADPVPNAGFKFYLKSDLTKNPDGSWNFAAATPVVVTNDGAREIFTDKNGEAKTIPLPYGIYIGTESTVPHNYSKCDDFEVTISDNSNEPQSWISLIDKEYESRLKIVKQDSETQKTVLKANASFKIKNLDTGEYIEQTTSYPSIIKHTVFKTDESGTLITPATLRPGRYQIEEVAAPDGYLLGDPVQIIIDEDTYAQMDPDTNTPIITVTVEDDQAKGKVNLVKTGELLLNYQAADTQSNVEFEYAERPLEDVAFNIYAAEDIFSQDGQGTLLYAKDALVGQMVTDEFGSASYEGLYIGKYYVKEVVAPDGFVPDTKAYPFEITYKNDETPVIETSVAIKNVRPTLDLSVLKVEEGTEIGLKGAVFGLYADEDIKAYNGTLLIEKDTLIETIETDQDGKAYVTKDLPLGKYYFLELQAPEGYVVDENKYPVEFSVNDATEENPQVVICKTIENKPIEIDITKTDITTSEEIPGATLTIYPVRDGEPVYGEAFETWVSDGTPHIVKRIPVGDYILVEESAPFDDGYVTAQSISFTVTADGIMQKIEMKDDHTKLEISKTDITTGDPVPGAELSIYPVIDGQPSDTPLYEWTTTDEVYEITYIPVGDYILREELPPSEDGYVKAQDVPFTVRDTGEIQKVEMQDDYTKLEISKTDITTGELVPGAELSIYPVINGQPSDTPLYEWTATDEVYEITYIPTGDYILREELPPSEDGYIKAQDVPFTVEDTGEIQKVEMKDDYTKVEISKVNENTDQLISGAKLELRDEEGNLIDSWISDSEPHQINYIAPGKYVLKELSAPEGYLLADDMEITVKDTGDVQIFVMKDKPIGKVTGNYPNGPKTGDPMSAYGPMAFGAMVLSLTIILFLLWYKKPQKYQLFTSRLNLTSKKNKEKDK